MKQNVTVAGVGEVLWDVFPDEKRIGGAPANFARNVSQLGIEAYSVSCVGADALGVRAKDELEASGVKVDFLFTHPSLPVGVVDVTLDSQGKPSYRIADNVAWDDIPDSPELQAAAGEFDAICFGTLAQRTEPARDRIRKLLEAVPAMALKILDVNLRAPFYSQEIVTGSLEMANVLKLSDEELPVLAGYYGLLGEETQQLTQLVSRFDLRLVAYTKGDAGSILVTADQIDVAEAVPVKVVDSVGAGDAFTAALCVGLLRGFTLSACNRFANQVAAYVCSCRGACPVLPEELLSIPPGDWSAFDE